MWNQHVHIYEYLEMICATLVRQRKLSEVSKYDLVNYAKKSFILESQTILSRDYCRRFVRVMVSLRGGNDVWPRFSAAKTIDRAKTITAFELGSTVK